MHSTLPSTRALVSSLGGDKLIFVVEGLFEKSDSIGYDCVRQFYELRRMFPEMPLHLFSGKFDQEIYPDIPAEPISALIEKIDSIKNSILLYHYCDGWELFEKALHRFQGRLIVRWHNNTPPWFLSNRRNYVERTLRGYERILALAERPETEFWCNSNFSADQLAVLGVPRLKCRVVYPGSRFLDVPIRAIRTGVTQKEMKNSFNILFVSRIVPHKGHRHVINVAFFLRRIVDLPIVVHFPGRLDIHEYADELRTLATNLGVEVRLHGEVDNMTLQNLFLNANCLLFLSEHEGFGLPIYEAVRMRLPVIAWSITAVKEIMELHPLASPTLNYRKFAEYASVLNDDSLRTDIIQWQTDNIVPIYTSDRIAEQMSSALMRSDESTISIHEPTKELRTRIAAYLEQREWDTEEEMTPIEISRTIQEIPGNFVTRYDIQSYLTLFNDDLSPLREEGQVSSQAGVRVKPSRFSRRGGKITGEGLRFDLSSVPVRHFIFGPFIQLPGGDFRAEFDILVENAPPTSGPLVFEVAYDKEMLSQLECFSVDFEEFFLPTVEFSNLNSNKSIEFRVWCKNWSKGSLLFRGVNLYRLPSTQEIMQFSIEYQLSTKDNIEVLETKDNGNFIKRFWPTRRKAETNTISKADAARDRKDWNAAIALYQQGLEVNANNFAVLVQYANCLKETRRFMRAENAYKKALRLAPTDADIHLQLGHLMKIRGRKIEAIAYYARSLALSKAGTYAIEELSALGLALPPGNKVRPFF